MNNPIHTHTLELDITCAGHTKTHDLRVMYTYTAGHRDAYYNDQLDPAEPPQVEIHAIDEMVLNKTIEGVRTEFYTREMTLVTEYIWDSPEHIEAIEREILEGLE